MLATGVLQRQLAPWPPKISKKHRIALKIRGELLHAYPCYTMLGFARWFLFGICAGPRDCQTFFRGDASTATSARALTWQTQTHPLFSETAASCYMILADRGVYILPFAVRNQQLCTNPNTFGVARSQSWRSWVGTSLFGLRPSTHC